MIEETTMTPSYLNDAHIAAMFERLRRFGDRYAGCGSEAEDMDHHVTEMLATWTVCLWLGSVREVDRVAGMLKVPLTTAGLIDLVQRANDTTTTVELVADGHAAQVTHKGKVIAYVVAEDCGRVMLGGRR